MPPETVAPNSGRRQPLCSYPVLRAPLDEEGDEVADRRGGELGAGLRDDTGDLFGRHLWELLRQAFDDLVDGAIFFGPVHVSWSPGTRAEIKGLDGFRHWQVSAPNPLNTNRSRYIVDVSRQLLVKERWSA